jgi:hypothetical protein
VFFPWQRLLISPDDSSLRLICNGFNSPLDTPRQTALLFFLWKKYKEGTERWVIQPHIPSFSHMWTHIYTHTHAHVHTHTHACRCTSVLPIPQLFLGDLGHILPLPAHTAWQPSISRIFYSNRISASLKFVLESPC